MQRERMEGIVRTYAEYLQQTEVLTQEQALVKAHYIGQEFKSWLIDQSEFGFWYWSRPYTEEFEKSDIFAGDIAKQEKNLIPYDIVSALWLVLRKQEYT